MAIRVIALLFVLGYVASAEPVQFGYNISGYGIGKIVGGSDAKKGHFPHLVSLQWGLPPLTEFQHFCGGSIINSQWILTVAHCVTAVPSYGTFVVKAGKHVITETEDTEQSINVSKTFVHESYAGIGTWDIGLLKLSSPLKFNKNVAPINLPSPGSIPTGMATVSDWGSISNSPCSGASGVPLIRERSDGENELIGIASWVVASCGVVNGVSVYTRVSAFNDWISSIVDNN